MPNFDYVNYMLSYFALIGLTAYVANLLVHKLTTFDDIAAIEGGNLGVSLRSVGLFGCIGLGISGVMTTEASPTWLAEMKDSLVCCGVLLVMALVALQFNNWVILRGINNNAALQSADAKVGISIGLVECASLFGTGIIAHYSLAAPGPLGAKIVFFVLGQLGMLLGTQAYEKLRRDVVVLQQIAQGNLAAAILISAKLIGLSLIMGNAVSGKFTDWATDLIAFAISMVVGWFMLLVAEMLMDWKLLPNTTVSSAIVSNNYASMTLVAGGTVGMAIAIASITI